MSQRNTGSKPEPMKTRKTSKKERATSGMSDISEAFKMASNRKNCNNETIELGTENATATQTPSPLNGDNSTKTSENAALEKDKAFSNVAIQVNVDELHENAGVNKGVTVDSSKEEMLEALQELTDKFDKLDNIINHPKQGIGAQVVNLTLKGDNLYSDIHGAVDGVLVKLANMNKEVDVTKQSTQNMEKNQDRLTKMLAENKRLSQDLTITQGILQKYSQKIQVLEQKILDLTRRGMEQNLVFHAIEEADDPVNEDCYRTVANFVHAFLGFEIDPQDIWKAYRLGPHRENKARPIFTKLAYQAKDKIMDNVGALKDKKNVHDQVRFIAEQIPDGIQEIRKNVNKRAAALRKIEDAKPRDQQRPVKVLGDKVIVGGFVQKAEVETPQTMDLFPSVEDQKQINQIARYIKEAEPIYERNSTFVGLAVEVKSVQETNTAYKAVMQRFPFMDHVMMAYQFRSPEDGGIKYGSCDDQEHGGGSAISRFLHLNKIKDIAVFVVRRYGGLHLGPDRFNTITKAAKSAIAILRPDGQQ